MQRYYDGQKGACGCGTGNSLFPWQEGISDGVYTAAGSQALFGAAGSTWCGSGCGTCYKLTSTGKAPCSTCGTGGAAGKSIIVMVTNLCPYNGNQKWCPNAGWVFLLFLFLLLFLGQSCRCVFIWIWMALWKRSARRRVRV
jgi:endoglucanase